MISQPYEKKYLKCLKRSAGGNPNYFDELEFNQLVTSVSSPVAQPKSLRTLSQGSQTGARLREGEASRVNVYVCVCVRVHL